MAVDLIVGNSSDPEVLAAHERVGMLRLASKEDARERAYEGFTLDEVRDIVGDANFFQARRIVEQHLGNLSGDERARVEREIRDDPMKMGNYWAEVAGLGNLPKDATAIDAEIAGIRKHMGNHGQPPYYKGPEADRLQLRYRALLRAKDATKAK